MYILRMYVSVFNRYVIYLFKDAMTGDSVF